MSQPEVNRDRYPVFVCDLCGDLTDKPGPCERCQAPLTEEVAARWLLTLMAGEEMLDTRREVRR